MNTDPRRLDTLLDLHAKLSTVVRYYDRMLEERLSNAYSQHSLGYGPLQGGPQYSNIYPSMAADRKGGVENFYFENPVAESQKQPGTPYTQYQPERDGYERGAVPGGAPGGVMTTGNYARPSQPVRHNTDPPNQPWNAYSHTATPQPPSTNIPFPTDPSVPEQVPPPANFYSPPAQLEQDASQLQPPPQRAPEAPYPPSPVIRRDSQYQQVAPPPAPVPSAPEQQSSTDHLQSSGYRQYPETQTMQPNGQSSIQQQPTGPSAQSYYFQQPSQLPAPSAYPQPAPMNYGAYAADPSLTGVHPAAQYQPQPPSQPVVEESLIEL